MWMKKPVSAAACLTLLHVLSLLQAAVPSDVDALDHFERRIRPVLIDHCYTCHSGDDAENGLRLDSRQGLLKGGLFGPAIVPGNLEAGLLLGAIEYTRPELQMPPDYKLDSSVIADFKRWISAGAPYPETAAAAEEVDTASVSPPSSDSAEAARNWWSFQPVSDPVPPQIATAREQMQPLDSFIRDKLNQQGIVPAVPADKRTLLRRAYFDLLGIPPTPDQIAIFVADQSPDAFARVVDQLLESPLYGQRWARHWLDLVRYCDSRNILDEYPFPTWRYRDWVVDALNQDMPYDQFLTDQLAGDMLAGDGDNFDARKIVATGVLALGEWGYGNSGLGKMITDIVDDQVDLVGRGFLGITLACARCHDHKYDPFTIEDYYALAGIFFSTHINGEPDESGVDQPVMQIPLEPDSVTNRRQNLIRERQALEKGIKTIHQAYVAAAHQREQPKAAEYLAACASLQRRVAVAEDIGRAIIDDEAISRDLESDVLVAWLKYLGIWHKEELAVLPGGLLEKFEKDFDGVKLQGWGYVTLPWIFSNQSTVEATAPTVPVGCLVFQPSPNQPVAVGWRCPSDMEVEVEVHLSDAYAGSADGVRWSVEVSRHGLRKELVHGICNDGESSGMHLPSTPQQRRWLKLRRGDWLALILDVIEDYHGDNYLVELTIRETSGEHREWDLVKDVANDIQSGNPHVDSYGDPSWSFIALRKKSRSGETLPWLLPDSALAKWYAAVADSAQESNLEERTQHLAGMLAGAIPPEINPSDEVVVGDYAAPDRALWSLIEPTHFDPDDQKEVDDARTLIANIQKTIRSISQVEFTLGAQEGGVPESQYEGIHDVRVHKRGRFDRLGEVVSRDFPQVLKTGATLGQLTGSGRLELAKWLADGRNPLTARVMVNRIWQYHFGRGIVGTPNNFGKLGTPPSHPELLDYLAAQFVKTGWSIKKMHRLIMNTRTYQQSSRPGAESIERDPDNKLLGRAPRRRLEAEAIRDAMLAVAGKLDISSGGPPVTGLSNPRRTLYLASVRSDVSSYPRLFDGADNTSIVGLRDESTVAPMSLFMLNHPFVRQQAEALGKRLASQAGTSPEKMVNFAYETLYARRPTPTETQIGVLAIADGRTEALVDYCHILLSTNEFVYIH